MEFEQSIVTNKHVGYSFSISIETEMRVETGAKYPDKTVTSARLSGNAETFEEVVKQLEEAKGKLKEMLKSE